MHIPDEQDDAPANALRNRDAKDTAGVDQLIIKRFLNPDLPFLGLWFGPDRRTSSPFLDNSGTHNLYLLSVGRSYHIRREVVNYIWDTVIIVMPQGFWHLVKT